MIVEMNTASLPSPATSAASASARQVQPYLFFHGRCEEALNYYRSALGAEVTALLRFKDNPEADTCQDGPTPPADHIMHASFRVGQTEILVSDGCDAGPTQFDGFALSLTVPDEADADHVFSTLAEEGKVQMPLMKTFFSARFGMVSDRFGVCWMVYVNP
jgi:PhnB protein